MKALNELSVQDIQVALAKKKLSALELARFYIRKIAELDSAGPKLNTLLELNPDALDIAESLDREYAQQGPRGPLHGVPVLIKGNIDTGDKMRTSAGSRALENNFAPSDAFLVKMLRESGAVILGKANLTELANFLANGMRGGYSSLGGQVVNPLGAGLEVGGSSSGSAAAVSAGFCTAAVGTETNGSILHPARRCGVIGIKPTKGLVSRTGIVPISSSFDTAGPLARSVQDAAMLLWSMIGDDPADPATRFTGDIPMPAPSYFWDASLQGKRIAVDTLAAENASPEDAKLFEELLAAMRDEGAELYDVKLPAADREAVTAVEAYEIKRCMEAYLAKHPAAGLRTVSDILRFNEEHEGCLKYGQERLAEADRVSSGRLNEAEYLRALDVIRASRTEIDDALAGGAIAIAMCGHNNVPPASGYPAISLPSGRLPDGQAAALNLIGTGFSDFELCRAAYVLERAGALYKPPFAY